MRTVIEESQAGLEVLDLSSDAEFASRSLRQRDPSREVEALRRLAQVFAKSSDAVLQELVEIAIELCGADSAGISVEQLDDPANPHFRWVAIGGKFARFLNGTTPRFYSPCGTCLDRNQAQLFRVTKDYYDALGIEAEPVTDGILIPWRAERMRGTIWVVAHESTQAFDGEDYKMMVNLGNFSAIAVRHDHRQKMLMKHATTTAASAMANELAHRINNPLQSLTNTFFLVAQGGNDAQMLAKQASVDLAKLSELVQKLLSLQNVTRGAL
jgi:hypothetical protein